VLASPKECEKEKGSEMARDKECENTREWNCSKKEGVL